MNEIFERIKSLRKEQHLSQDYVAKYLDMNRSSYTQLENGKRKATAEDIARLCDLFKVSADAILNKQSYEQPAIMFARSFEKLSEADQNEIMNLIRFKEQMKNNRENRT